MSLQAQLQEIYEENLRQRDGAASSSSGGGMSGTNLQFLEDERIALMLQNEEFMAELRRDHEFMSALEEDEQHGRQQQPHPHQQPQPQHPQPPKRVSPTLLADISSVYSKFD